MELKLQKPYHARNDIYNAEQNQEQGFGLFM